MRKASITKLAASVAVASALAVSSAQATLIYNVSGPGQTAAEQGQQDFLDSLHAGTDVTEGFEGFASQTQQNTFNTAVGDFHAYAPAGQGQSCSAESFECDEGLGIVGMDDYDLMNADGSGDQDPDTFWGRFAMPVDENNNRYLDSLDHEQVKFDLIEGKNAVGFFLTDPNDAGGILSIDMAGGGGFSATIDDILGGQQPNETSFFLSFYSFGQDIESLTLDMENATDGIGIDNVTVGRVPEPGTLALLGLGLVGLVFANRQRGQRAA